MCQKFWFQWTRTAFLSLGMVYRAYFRYEYDVTLMSMTSSPFDFRGRLLFCGLPPLNFWWWNVFFNVNICTSFSMSIYVLLVWGFFNFDDSWARFKALAAFYQLFWWFMRLLPRLWFSSFYFANSGESPPPRGSGPGCPSKSALFFDPSPVDFVFWRFQAYMALSMAFWANPGTPPSGARAGLDLTNWKGG